MCLAFTWAPVCQLTQQDVPDQRLRFRARGCLVLLIRAFVLDSKGICRRVLFCKHKRTSLGKFEQMHAYVAVRDFQVFMQNN